MRTRFGISSSWFLFLAASSALVSADFVIKDGQLAVVDSSGISIETLEVSATGTRSVKTLSLSPENTLKLSFQILASPSNEKESKGIAPHQVHLLATGLKTNLHWTAVVKVRGANKAKWELDMARAPTDFFSLGENIKLELLIADQSTSHKPLRQELATLKLAPSMVLPYPYWDTKDGLPQPPLEWTFRAPRKPINPIFSLAFTIIALSPWLILLSAWSTLANCSTPGFKIIGSTSPSTIIFLATIASQEILILTYWSSLRLYQYLPIAFFLSLPLILSGRTALSELRARRKRNPISASNIIISKINGNRSKGKGKAE
ncbi:hypothetical protein CROQUDRAFT_237369 [Cronartium quercuum f. sp. fusiforme G11]|uniref:Ribophorin II n=1 Tax=Cronartium quercuum f. sp. fusiforme G11 TaxID=708437 RepID=A0A9P6NEQ8_9BASI|nr:hypothetical protein CROQUDRAFT_237369 [Cronartium quercuum f. sp. fusiforme G11]